MTVKNKIGGAAAASLAAIICGTVGSNYVGTDSSDSVSVTYDQLVSISSAHTEQTTLYEGTVEVTLYSSSAQFTTRLPQTASTTAITTVTATTVSSVATSASAVVTTSIPEPVTIEDEIVITVYVSNSGKYHSKSNCSGMKNYTEMSLDEALDAGHVACKKCW